MNRVLTLKNPIQDYPWGSTTAIPEIRGVSPQPGKPQAELWMGAHPKAPSEVELDGRRVRLDELIARHPEPILGRRVARRFENRLPFLFKILAAAEPLSLQAHPDRRQARQGFARENRSRIPLDSPRRNYRDANHKPECICALTPFWALCGFRTPDEIRNGAERLQSRLYQRQVQPLKRGSDPDACRVFLQNMLSLTAEEKQALIEDTLAAARPAGGDDPALHWISVLAEKYPRDIGVLAPLFLNLVQLQPGQALRLPAGELHAYLGGTGIELMANSDNVLRGGLTSKHIDVPELLRVLTFSAGPLTVLEPGPDAAGESIYPNHAEEFVLSAIRLVPERVYETRGEPGVEIHLCTDGRATITEIDSGRKTELNKGMSVLIPAAAGRYHMEGEAWIYKAAVP